MNTTFDVLYDVSSVRRIALWENPGKEKRAQLASFLLAVSIHALFFLAGGIAFVKQAEYGIESAQGGMEIYMVAALPKEVTKGAMLPEQEVIDQEKHEMEMAIPKKETEKRGSEKSKSNSRHLQASQNEFVGDGSSPVPGKNKTTFFSMGGGSVDDKPGYLKNPAPPYPREALQQNQEGLVMLSVMVDRTGRATEVSVKQSSGYPLLDESALKTVKKWKFRAGRMGFLSAESHLQVPIRFLLKDARR